MKAEKRRAIPMKVQRDVALDLCRDLMRKLGLVEVDATIEFDLDHNPALELRAVNPETGQHQPDQHDPAFLVWRPRQEHRVKTTGRRGESDLSIRDGDQQKIAKNRRREKKRAEREATRAALPEPPPGRMKAKPPSRWPKRKLQSRKSFEDRRSR